MATTFQLVCGSTTLDLNAGDYALLSYTPKVGKKDGSGTVTETARVMISDTSVANIAAARDLVDDMVALLDLWDRTRTSSRVYLHFQPDGLGTTYRSQVKDIGLQHEEDVHAVPLDNLKMQLTLAITRDNFWEDTSETNVSLTNSHGTASTGLQVDNTIEDTTWQNFVTIAADGIAGDLPARCRIEMTNATAAGEISRIWIGQMISADVASFTPIFEAENSDGVAGGTVLSDGSYSDNEGLRFAVADSLEVEIGSWSMSAAQLGYMKGNWFKPFVRFIGNRNAAVKFKIVVEYVSAGVYEGPWMQFTSGNLDLNPLPALQLPPWLAGQGSINALNLQLMAYHELGSSQNIDFDFVYLLPLMGYREIFHTSYAPVQNERVVDDGFEEILYKDNGAGAGKAATLSAVGKRILLQPGIAQRLYFFVQDADGDALVNRNTTVKVIYRVRRLTL